MQVVLCGVFLWLIAGLAAWRLARRLPPCGRGRAGAWVWASMVVLAAVLMFRPHEDIFGGEDPGAYLNSGAAYGRQGRFFFTDDLLSLVRPDLRPLFYFGHAGYGPTKDACLWVCNEDLALVGPHFQPAYPLLIAAAVRLAGTPDAALYVVPFFAMLAALALAVLAGRLLTPRPWCGLAAFWLFLLNPLTAWHGRAPRPEIIAACMLFGGLAILMTAAPPRRRGADIWLGGACLMLAPFFHVTAWYAVLPALALTVMLIGAGRREWLPVLLAAALALNLLDYQARRITDYYGLGHMMWRMLGDPRGWLAAAAAAGGLLAAGRTAKWAMALAWAPRARRVAAWLAGAAGAGLPLYYYFRRDALGSLPFLGRPVEHFLYVTDFQALVNMISLPSACAALAGWMVWCVWPASGRLRGPAARNRWTRLALAAAAWPGIVLAGRINDFMMTRYLMVAAIPMLALCLAALAGAAGAAAGRLWRGCAGRRPVAPAAALMAAALLAGLGCRHRAHLLAVTEYRGLADFLRPFAGIVRAAEGALLVEYSRLAAPFDHYFNLPVLGIDNERRTSYARIEEELERLMRQFPDVPVYFITPFHAPVSDRFVFAPVLEGVWNYRRLRQAGRRLPVDVRRNDMTLAMFRMRLADKAPAGCRDWSEPCLIRFDAGNMGLRQFANLRSGRWRMRCAGLNDLRAVWPSAGPGEEMLLLDMGGGTAPAGPWQVWPLEEEWRVWRIPSAAYSAFAGAAPNLDAIAGCTAWRGPRRLRDLLANTPAEILVRREMPPMQARWARGRAAMLLPRPPAPAGRLLVLARAPPQAVHLNLEAEGASLWDGMLPPMEWQWVVAPFSRQISEPEWVWVEMQAQPTWDSGAAGFPPDLGVLVGAVAVLP